MTEEKPVSVVSNIRAAQQELHDIARLLERHGYKPQADRLLSIAYQRYSVLPSLADICASLELEESWTGGTAEEEEPDRAGWQR